MLPKHSKHRIVMLRSQKQPAIVFVDNFKLVVSLLNMCSKKCFDQWNFEKQTLYRYGEPDIDPILMLFKST